MFSRNIAPRLAECLADTPVVVVQGPRQCGKSTLVQQNSDATYITLDDALARSAASHSPASFLKSQADRVVIDEVQREPGLFRELKRIVDADRRPGRFLLTGSANILLVPKLADSLAGRMEVIPLWPLSQGEIEGRTEDFATWAFSDAPIPKIAPCDDLAARIERGGFPEPLQRSSAQRRQAWHAAYIKALLERDVRDMADIEGLATLPRLLSALAKRPYEVLNISSLARETGVAHSTLTRYLTLLEGVFLIKSIPAFTTTDAKTAKTARVAFVDSGVQAYLAPGTELTADQIAGFLAVEMIKQSAWSQTDFEVLHFRSVRHHSVPLVLRSRTGKIVGISVIDRGEPEPSDFKALEFLAEIADESFVRGLVLHQGNRSLTMTEKMATLPISALWRA